MKYPKSRFFALPAVLVMAMGVPPLQAQSLPAQGGSGGAEFRLACERGEYVVGLRVNAGAWLDGISLMCAAREGESFRMGSPRARGTAGGQGGNNRVVTCPREDLAVGAAVFTTTINEGRAGFVTGLSLECRYLEPPHEPWPVTINVVELAARGGGVNLMGDDNRTFFSSRCPSGALATGFHGRAGRHVDALGITCGPAPTRPPVRAMGRQSAPGRDASSVTAGSAAATTRAVESGPPILRGNATTPAAAATASPVVRRAGSQPYDREHGGIDGQLIVERCPQGEYLVGMRTAPRLLTVAGSMGLICARPQGTRLGTWSVHMIGGLPPNSGLDSVCPAASAVRGFGLGLSGPEDVAATTVQGIKLVCGLLLPAHTRQQDPWPLGQTPETWRVQTQEIMCPSNRPMAVGVRLMHRASNQLTAFGLVCEGRLP